MLVMAQEAHRVRGWMLVMAQEAHRVRGWMLVMAQGAHRVRGRMLLVTQGAHRVRRRVLVMALGSAVLNISRTKVKSTCLSMEKGVTKPAGKQTHLSFCMQETELILYKEEGKHLGSSDL